MRAAMSDKYILVGKNAVPTDDLIVWGKWLQEHRVTCPECGAMMGPVSEIGTQLAIMAWNIRQPEAA